MIWLLFCASRNHLLSCGSGVRAPPGTFEKSPWLCGFYSQTPRVIFMVVANTSQILTANHFSSGRNISSKRFTASLCIVSVTCEYVSAVCWMDACPKRSETIFSGTCPNNNEVAWVCRKKSKRLDFLRHTFASLMHYGGVGIKEISGILGHSNLSTTSEIYTHLLDETFVNQLSVMDKYFPKWLGSMMEVRFLLDALK